MTCSPGKEWCLRMNVTDIDGGCEVKSIEALSESRVPRLHITTHTIMGGGGGGGREYNLYT